MSNDLNNCTFIGRLGKDPETRFLPNGDAVTNFTLAVGWKGKDKEGTEWVRCNTFGKLAEICGEYLSKGKQCFVSGRMSTREWEKDGVKRYTTEINVDRMQLLGSRDDGGERAPGAQQRQASAPARKAAPATSTGFDDMDDSIPFILSLNEFDIATPKQRRLARGG